MEFNDIGLRKLMGRLYGFHVRAIIAAIDDWNFDDFACYALVFFKCLKLIYKNILGGMR